MIDIHCHILPGIDDGAQSLEESVEMARIASEEGIREIINTSHYHVESDFLTGKAVLEAADTLRKELSRLGIEIDIHIGNELYFNESLLGKLDECEFFTLAGSRYVLVEFRPDKIPDDIDDFAYEFRIRGYVPIIAHVERYSQVVSDIEKTKEFIDAGCLLQMNSRSVIQARGSRIGDFCKEAVRRNMIHFVASDAHDSKIRTPALKDARKEIERIAGKKSAREVFEVNPAKILKDETILPPKIGARHLFINFLNILKIGRK